MDNRENGYEGDEKLPIIDHLKSTTADSIFEQILRVICQCNSNDIKIRSIHGICEYYIKSRIKGLND